MVRYSLRKSILSLCLACLLTNSPSIDDVKPVGVEETLEGLWGSDKTDPKEAFEANGFKMRRVVLTRAPNSRGRGGKKSDQSK